MRALRVQVKILGAVERAPQDRCYWVSEKDMSLPPSLTSPGEVWGLENREGLCYYVSHFPGTARGSRHQDHDCQGCVGCRVTESTKL